MADGEQRKWICASDEGQETLKKTFEKLVENVTGYGIPKKHYSFIAVEALYIVILSYFHPSHHYASSAHYRCFLWK